MEDPFVRDEDFLLRCASTYNWNLLLERCILIKDIFSSPSSSPNHSLRVAAGICQLQATDQWGNTALHLACFHSAPTRVIIVLLEAAGAADPPIQMTSFLTGDNSTPLLIACATRAAPDTIHTLLNPPSPQLVRGGLHAGYPDDQGSTPLSELWTLYKKRMNRPLSPKALVTTEAQLWTNADAILKAAWNAKPETRGEQSKSVLHSVANMAESCPVELSDRLLERYGEYASTRDERGMLPLDIAISGQSLHMHQKLKEQGSYLIFKLLTLYPEAARTLLPGRNNPRTTFCRAIASGLDWHVVSSDGNNEGPLMRLWQCAPEALPSRDMVTGLYPFLLAATVETRRGHDNTNDDTAKVNNVYNILRLYPQAIQDMLSNALS